MKKCFINQFMKRKKKRNISFLNETKIKEMRKKNLVEHVLSLLFSLAKPLQKALKFICSCFMQA